MNDDTTDLRARKRLDLALAARNFEIELFWKRSIFFWGFVAVTFAGYAAVRDRLPALGCMLACFGVVCATAWSLANRGSKYWYENWEQKIDVEELQVTGPLFAECRAPPAKGWLAARRFSVSRLTIALADYVAAFWAVLVGGEAWQLVTGTPVSLTVMRPLLLGFILVSVIFVGIMFRKTRSG